MVTESITSASAGVQQDKQAFLQSGENKTVHNIGCLPVSVLQKLVNEEVLFGKLNKLNDNLFCKWS